MHPVVEDTCRKMTQYIKNKIEENSSDGLDVKQVRFITQFSKYKISNIRLPNCLKTCKYIKRKYSAYSLVTHLISDY